MDGGWLVGDCNGGLVSDSKNVSKRDDRGETVLMRLQSAVMNANGLLILV